MILVTGATGNVGANIVNQLVEAGEKVRVLTRRPTDHAFPDQVEVVAGDLTRPDTLPAALTDVDRAFLFPLHGALDGFLDAAKRAGLRHVVLLSSAAVTHPTLGLIGEQHLRDERAVAASKVPWTFIRPDYFMTNDFVWAHQIANGDVVRGVYGNAAVPAIDPRDIASVAVRALIEARVGESFLLTGPQSLTQIDRVRIIAETVGRRVRFQEVAREQFRQQLIGHGMSTPVAEAYLDGLATLDGTIARTLPTVQEVTGRPPFTYAQWVAHHVAAFNPPQS